jgi:bacteriocin-like protein
LANRRKAVADKKENHSTHWKKETTSSQGKAGSPDKLTKAGKKGDKELSEDELKAVAGGATDDKHKDW